MRRGALINAFVNYLTLSIVTLRAIGMDRLKFSSRRADMKQDVLVGSCIVASITCHCSVG